MVTDGATADAGAATVDVGDASIDDAGDDERGVGDDGGIGKGKTVAGTGAASDSDANDIAGDDAKCATDTAGCNTRGGSGGGEGAGEGNTPGVAVGSSAPTCNTYTNT